MRLLVLLVLVLAPWMAHAAITIDAVTTSEGLTSTSHSHTIAADATAVIICPAERDTDLGGLTANTASVTVGGQAATQLIGVSDATPWVRSVMFYKLAPLTGAQTVAVTPDTGTDRIVTTVISLKNVAQTNTFNTAASVGSTGTGSTNADLDGIASAVGELVLVCGASSTSASTASPDATAPTSTEQSDVAHTNATSVRSWVYTEDGSATSTDVRVDLAASHRWAMAGAAIREVISAFGHLRRRH